MSIEKKNRFLEMRAKGETFDTIAREIGISKPTLINWGKLYEKEINYFRSFLMEKLGEKILKQNDEWLNIMVQQLVRLKQNPELSQSKKRKYMLRALRKIGYLFNIKVDMIELSLDKMENIVRIKIIAKDH
jgi:hypothetical protein